MLNKDEFLAPDKTTYDENPIVSGALPNQSAPKPSTFSPQGRIYISFSRYSFR
jgi:hypothetical protein